jgi:hypothetical protein
MTNMGCVPRYSLSSAAFYHAISLCFHGALNQDGTHLSAQEVETIAETRNVSMGLASRSSVVWRFGVSSRTSLCSWGWSALLPTMGLPRSTGGSHYMLPIEQSAFQPAYTS